MGLEDARILAARLRQRAIEGSKDAEEAAGLGLFALALLDGLEMSAGILSEPGTLRGVVRPEELEEADGFAERELRSLDRERRGDLL